MKEATGEANMTVVTIILIAAIVAIATPIVTNMMNNTQTKANCMNNGCYWDAKNKTCTDSTTGGVCSTSNNNNTQNNA